MSITVEADSLWTPVDGPDGTYCSPGCGFKCKKAAFDRATKEADELAARMGVGWDPVVWENCGWNYRVEKDKVAIYAHTNGSNLRGEWTVRNYGVMWATEPQICISADTPEDALGFAVQKARSLATQLNADCAALLEGQ